MLVTEQVVVVSPQLGLTFVLNRQANKFTAHFKGDPKPADQAKRERKHWDLSTALIRQWRKSADKDANSPLHLAIINDDLGLVKFFTRENMVNQPNKRGELPIHLAAKSANKDMLIFLVSKDCDLDAKDAHGNTALYLACVSGNLENVKTLIEAGANLDAKNDANQTPRSIIESSKVPKLKECLAINAKPKI